LVWLLFCVTIWITARHKVSKQQWLNSNKFVPIALEFGFEDVFDENLEEISVSLADKSILENPLALVRPQLEHVIFFQDGFSASFSNALEYFGDISQVISIMRFSWGWPELFHRILIN